MESIRTAAHTPWWSHPDKQYHVRNLDHPRTAFDDFFMCLNKLNGPAVSRNNIGFQSNSYLYSEVLWLSKYCQWNKSRPVSKVKLNKYKKQSNRLQRNLINDVQLDDLYILTNILVAYSAKDKLTQFVPNWWNKKGQNYPMTYSNEKYRTIIYTGYFGDNNQYR